MKRILLPTILAFSFFTAKAQTFTSSSGGAIPDAGPMVQFPITVSGLTPSTIDTTFGLETICFNITHTWDGDLSIYLQSPDGTIVNLSIGNGGSGDDYTNTCLNEGAANSIVTASSPFTGTFRPQGFIGAINNGQPGNGTWYLNIQDNYAADAGTLIDWSITFGTNPAKPFNFTSSNLPIVVVNTGGAVIPDEPKLAARMGIIYNGVGVRNYMTDPFNNYSDSIGIETRGSSSSGFPQKTYGIETRDINGIQKDTVVLGMPAEHDWILYAPYDDKTCIRNILSYDIANKTGHYASRTQLCEFVLNGQYQGIYVMMEKVKRDVNRVNVNKLLPTEITGDDLTGGYIIKVDRDDGPGSYWTSSYPADDGTPVNFVHVYPDFTTMAPQQRSYIMAYVDSLEDALAGPSFTDPAIGYRKYIGVNTFIDYFILNEVSNNVDGYRLSTFFHKDKMSKGGKLKAGPAWDYNLAWWNADYCNGDQYNTWAYQIGSVCGGGWQPNFWWRRLLEDPNYTAELRCRWDDLRLTTLSIPVLDNYIDSLAAYLNEAQARHFQAWPILGVYTWPNPSPLATDYAGEIANMKNWMHNRIAWLDANMPGTCNVGVHENILTDANVSVYPNPFSNAFNLQLYLPKADKIEMTIMDITGKIVQQDAFELPQGQNDFSVPVDEDLGKGIYLLNLRSADGAVVKKLTKVD
jgi:subtilisin-like proprotein convertase family protein